MNKDNEYGFSPSQQRAYEASFTGKNIFISGSGGNGKSYLTEKLIHGNTVVCAPTGVAAINVGGVTCHRLFGLPIGIPSKSDYHKVSTKARNALKSVTRLIISEIGMVRADMLDLMDAKLKVVKRNNKPFGGVQVIVEGDFFQLPPIVGYQERTWFHDNYDSPYSFSSKAWCFDVYELAEPQRHPNIDHYNLLNRIRVGDRSAIHEIKGISKDYELSEKTSHLCCYNKDADNINKYWFDRVMSSAHTYYAEVTGKISEKDVLVSNKIELKVGAKVIICANDEAGNYVNGSTGFVTSLGTGKVVVDINGVNTVVEPYTWENVEYVTNLDGGLEKVVIGSFTQIPIKLGWAVSIHKSQGMTLEDAAIHTGSGCFSSGQFYVACSRIRNLSKLQFIRKHRVTENDIVCDQDVVDFYNKVKQEDV